MTIPIQTLSKKRVSFKNLLEIKSNSLVLYEITAPFIKELEALKEEKKLEELKKIKAFIQTSSQNLFFISEEETLISLFSREFKNNNVIDFSDHYYLSVLNLFQKLFPTIDLTSLISEFRTPKREDNKNSFLPPSQELEASNSLLFYLKKILRNKKQKFTLLSLVGMILVSLGFLSFKMSVFDSPQKETSLHRADLLIPNSSVLLTRSSLLDQIDKKFKPQEGIAAVALIGLGGSGKTTLARCYARQQKENIVWEINAETKETLVTSFEILAYSLSKTEEEKKVLQEIQEIKNLPEKEEKLISFVRERLRTHSNWFLLYDNVENVTDIQKYYPQDSQVWGKGRIILTSRDENLKNYFGSHQIILLNELTSSEVLTLFNKILYEKDTHKLTPPEQQKIKLFLKNIPPFPLDISIAAYYIKNAHISYDQYLERINSFNQNLETVQAFFLKEISYYNKTRYNVLILSLKRLLETNKDFGDLLLFMCLLESQNIPRVLLDKYKNEVIVDSFIYNLKKYSLLTNDLPSMRTLSLHRITEEISLNYLIKALDLKNNPSILSSMATTLKNQMVEAINEEDIVKMALLRKQAESFLNHPLLIPADIKAIIGGELGGLYYYLGEDLKAKELLEQSLATLNKHPSRNHLEKARALSYLGAVYRLLGKYEKAKDLSEQSLLIYKQHPSYAIEAARVLAYLGFTYRELSKFEKAKDLLEQSLAIYKAHPHYQLGTARALEYLGIIYKDLGKYQKATALFEQSLFLRKQTPKYFGGICWTLVHLGTIYKELGNYRKARSLFEESLAIYKKHFSENHVELGGTLVPLAEVYKNLGYYEKAKDLLEKTLTIYKQHYPENHIDIGWTFIHLGNLYKSLGYYPQAQVFLEKALAIYNYHLSESHIDIGWILVCLGNVHRKLGNYEKAKSLIEKGLILYKKNIKEPTIKLGWVFLQLGAANEDLGQYIQAKLLFEKSLETYKKNFGENHFTTAGILGHLGTVYMHQGDYKKAKNFLEKNLTLYEKYYGKIHIKTARVLAKLADLYLKIGDIKTAESFLQKAREIFFEHKHPELYIYLENLGDLYLKRSIQEKTKGNLNQSHQFKKEAIKFLKQALQITKSYSSRQSLPNERITSVLKNIEKGK